jgi:hypothetical protein
MSMRSIAVRAGLGVAVACGGVGIFSAGARAGEACPNEALRQELSSGSLPDCRAYEMVTPVYKDGAAVNIRAVSGDGSRVLGQAAQLGAFAGTGGEPYGSTYYEFSRLSSGWVASALDPPASEFPEPKFFDSSGDLTRTLWGLHRPSQSIYEEDLYVREAGGRFVEVGPLVPPSRGAGPPAGSSSIAARAGTIYTEYVGASADVSRVLVSIWSRSGTVGVLWPGDTTLADSAKSLYEYVGTGLKRPELVGVNNEGKQITSCGTELGDKEPRGVGEKYNAVSADGERVFFTANACGVRVGEPEVDELYARVDGVETVDLSEPLFSQCGGCQTGTATRTEPATTEKPAKFAGASEDGSKVFFTTEQALLPGQTTNSLYEYDFNNPGEERGNEGGEKVVLVSKGSPEPRVLGVARVSEDGSHVYFVAQGVLTAQPNREGHSPLAGANNLYVFERDAAHLNGRVSFVTTLSSETQAELTKAEEPCAALSGEEKEACEAPFIAEFNSKNETDNADWREADLRPVQATPDGRFLVFQSKEQLFEYDAQTEELVNVSTGHAATIPEALYSSDDFPSAAESHLAVSSDGSYVVFTESGGRLSEYHSVGSISNGSTHLLSDELERRESVGVDASGGDVFFQSDASLLATDVNSGGDIYDARVDGGFPVPAAPAGCRGGACQGAAVTPPVFGAPASTTLPSSGNPAPASPVTVVTSKEKRKTAGEIRAEELDRALKACRSKAKRARASCEKRARKRYGPITRAEKTSDNHRRAGR